MSEEKSEIKFTEVGTDGFSRKLFRHEPTGVIVVEVDGFLYDRTDYGEPISKLGKLPAHGVEYLPEK